MQVLISTSQQQNYVIPQLKCVHLILNKTTGLINTRILHSASTSVTFSVTLANSVGMNYNNNYMIVLFISALFLPSLRIFHRHCLYLEIHQYTIECFTYMTMHLTQITVLLTYDQRMTKCCTCTQMYLEWVSSMIRDAFISDAQHQAMRETVAKQIKTRTNTCHWQYNSNICNQEIPAVKPFIIQKCCYYSCRLASHQRCRLLLLRNSTWLVSKHNLLQLPNSSSRIESLTTTFNFIHSFI